MTPVQAQNVTGDSSSADIHLDSAGRWPGTPWGLQPWPPCGPSFQLRCPRIHQGQQEACPGVPVTAFWCHLPLPASLCPHPQPRCPRLAVTDGGLGLHGISRQRPVLLGARPDPGLAAGPALLSRPWHLRPRPHGPRAPSGAGLPPPQRMLGPVGDLGQVGTGGLAWC